MRMVCAFTGHGDGKIGDARPDRAERRRLPGDEAQDSEATNVTVATLAATLTPLAICCPTRYLSRVGDLCQGRMEGG